MDQFADWITNFTKLTNSRPDRSNELQFLPAEILVPRLSSTVCWKKTLRGASCENGKTSQLYTVEAMKMIRTRMVRERCSLRLNGARGRMMNSETNDVIA